jgi:hypothetical protein
MVQRDFFAFCKSLQLIELKAIGSLSPVRHFADSEIVYSAGEDGHELFIVTRGAAELLPQNARAGAPTTVLSRGDIFGETGALMELPRNNTARACGKASASALPMPTAWLPWPGKTKAAAIADSFRKIGPNGPNIGETVKLTADRAARNLK